MRLADAYAECERLARSHYENFPVASFLLPKHMRRHIAAIYVFARMADDLADEGRVPADARLAQLDDWRAQLHAACAEDEPDPIGGSEPGPVPRRPHPWQAGEGEPIAPVFRALADTIRVHRLPLSLFDDLISAFKQDVVKNRYESWDELLDYCRRSANPVGRLVLRVAGHVDGRLDAASDAVCTALQLTNFWQDIEKDWEKGRVYVPRVDRDRFGADEMDLGRRSWTLAWHKALGEMAARTSALFDTGRPVCDGVTGRLRFELRFTWLGGTRVLRKLDAAGFNVFGTRPTLGRTDVPALVWQALTWKTGGRMLPS